MKRTRTLWDDCKVAFGVDHDEPFDADANWESTNLPAGWKLNEVDGSGARWVAVFRITVMPTREDVLAVRRWLRKIGAINKRRN